MVEKILNTGFLVSHYEDIRVGVVAKHKDVHIHISSSDSSLKSYIAPFDSLGEALYHQHSFKGQYAIYSMLYKVYF